MKTKLGGVNALYPSLTVIAGAVVEGRANFSCIAHAGTMNYGQKHLIALSFGKSHYTCQGIREHGQFSVNVPGVDLVAETDYVGIVSGRREDKSALFEVFYGELEHAPLIAQCPVCMECRLERVIDFTSHDVFVGEVVQTHADEAALTGGKIDSAKVQPLLFDMGSMHYYSLGPAVAKCWDAGKKLKNKD